MSYNYWISLHSHTMYSNNSYFEVATKPEDYIAYARKYNLPAVCITEHGGVFGWIKKKEMIEAHGMKYIHGIEAYVTMDLEDKNRGYHTILIAKNYEGVKEINRLSSQSFNRQDGHFYYRPRILFDDLKAQVEHGNIFVTTACMGGALHQSFKESKMSLDKSCSIIESNSEDRAAQVFKKWVEFALENKDRVFLEVQPHYDREQAEYNELLSRLSNQYGLKLVAANDIHALNQQHDKLRKLIKKGKRSTYDDEDNFELWCKDRAEMVTDFQRQGVLDDTQIQSSLDMTVEIANSVEEFEIDKSHKYPKLYEDPEKEFKRRIKEGLIKRGIDKLPADQRKQYIARVNHEYKVYKGNGAIDYMLSHEDILNAAKEQGVKFGFGRGSCFIGDTSILMADYSTKRIQDVRKGDMVITHDGSPHEVKAIHRRKATRLIRTTFAGGLPLYSTENHKFLVRKRGERTDPKLAYPVSATPVWGRADELRNSDLLCTPIPRLKEKHMPIVDLTNYSYDNTNYDETSIWSDIGSNHLKRSVTKRFLNMANPDIAWLSGVYVGNGWAEVCRNEKEKQGNRYRFGVCFCGDQTEKIDRAKRILSNLVGADHVSTFKGYEGKNLVQLVVYNQFLSQFYLEQFGHYAANKKIPQFYMTSGNKETIKEFLKGMWQTDGHISQKEPRWKYSSTNKKLVEQLSILMMSLGFLGHPVCRVHKNIDWNDEYTLSYSGGQLYKMNAYFGFAGKTNARWNRFKKDANYFYGKVRKTEPVECDSIDVYDLTVEGNHSYIANNVAVHNCSGSLIAYLCGQTDMDAVKLGLNFERFMNPERISLADIDVDAYKDDQQWIQKWILTNPKWHAASIMTANTYGLKGAIKAIAAGMDKYTGKPAYVQSICNQIEDDGSYSHELYMAHKELIDNAKEVIGVIDSFGRHAAGIVIDTNTIDDTMGTQTISGWDYPVTQVAMKEIDHFNWVKYDMLGLDNVGLINKAAELAGLEHPTPDSDFIDFEDEKVWNSMRSDNIGIFQMEGDRAGKLLRDMLSPETIANIRSTEVGKKVKYMDLLSLVNAAQRPSGASYVDAVTHGRFKDNGHPALNEFLAPTLGFLVYQEQLIEFLVRFCGYSAGKADLTRRAIGKKMADVIEKEVPEIHKAFVKTMVNKYDDNEEHAEKVAKDFMQVFMDAANYGFSINHSMAYSYIGYISTWLRYYYPLEWCTAAFEVWKDKQDKIVKVSRFAKEHDIKIKPVKFGKSKGLYFMNKEENAIYEGTASIKGLNAEVGDYLYLLSDKKYKNFTEFLLDIYDNNVINYQGQEYSALALYSAFKGGNLKLIDLSIKKGKASIYKSEKNGTTINKTHMINLILLNYFEQFGSPARLKTIYEFFKKIYKPNNKLLEKKQSKYYECLNFERELEVEDYSLVECLRNEFNLLGRCITVIPNMPTNYAFITNVKELSNRVRMSIYSIKKGRDVPVFMNKRDYNASGVKAGVIIKVFDVVKRPKNVMIDGHWIKSDTESDIFVRDFAMV